MENAGTSNNPCGRIEWTLKMNEKYENMSADKEVLKYRHKKLRSIYMILKALLNQSGFGWDDEKQMVTAETYVWDDYLKVHLEAKPMRTKTMPSYPDLEKNCRKSTVTGKYVRSAKDLKSKKLSDVNITQVQDSSDDATVEDDSPH
ncbi:hypothetical protein GIB67_015684, partial [Kingdonia uniflora]